MANAEQEPPEDQADALQEDPFSPFDSYHIRIMATLACSLLLVILFLHAPFYQSLQSIGWQFTDPQERIEINFVEERKEPLEDVGGDVIITLFGGEEEEVEEGEEETAGEEAEPEPEPEPELPTIEPLKLQARRVVLEVSDTPPRVVGGIGAYYINIQYPEAALRAGIEGQMVLSFVVETNGSASEIEILKSLHPACDSAAVSALRRTTFVPGRQNGEKVPVRMRLPVRFQLLQSATDSTATNTLNL